MSAPCSSGRIRYGVATVLSTMRGTPFLCATSATPSISKIETFGLLMVSAKKALVFGLTAAAHSFRSSWFSTKVVVIPSFGSVYLKRL